MDPGRPGGGHARSGPGPRLPPRNPGRPHLRETLGPPARLRRLALTRGGGWGLSRGRGIAAARAANPGSSPGRYRPRDSLPAAPPPEPSRSIPSAGETAARDGRKQGTGRPWSSRNRPVRVPTPATHRGPAHAGRSGRTGQTGGDPKRTARSSASRISRAGTPPTTAIPGASVGGTGFAGPRTARGSARHPRRPRSATTGHRAPQRRDRPCLHCLPRRTSAEPRLGRVSTETRPNSGRSPQSSR
jgi:hypothetical protein